jgi:hypothetical protein
MATKVQPRAARRAPFRRSGRARPASPATSACVCPAARPAGAFGDRVGGRLLAPGALLVLLFALARPAVTRAQTLSCGVLNPHTELSAVAQGQTPAQASDFTDHPLPWSVDLAQTSGQSDAHKKIDAVCQNSGASILINISSSDWGASNPASSNDTVKAAWAPIWTAPISLPPNKQLAISVSSSVNYLNCQLIAPGVAMNWSIPYSNTANTPAGVRHFVIGIDCTSGGLHDISQRATSGWVNGESIMLNITELDVARGPN